MKVVRADSLGFCFGVERALDMILGALKARGMSCKSNLLGPRPNKNGATASVHRPGAPAPGALQPGPPSPLCVLGDLIHNRVVVDELTRLGLRRIDSLDEAPPGSTLVVRAHGATREVYEGARDLGIEIIDATCPFVCKAQRAAASLLEKGCIVIVAGDRGHAEVRGIVSAAGGPVMVAATPGEIDSIPPSAKVGLVFQTTLDSGLAERFADALAGRCAELEIADTICRATQDRQNAVRELSPAVDAMVVVGDPGSANTARLRAIAASLNPRTMQVEHAGQLEESFFHGCSTVGLSAGASTPNLLIDEVERRLSGMPPDFKACR